MKRSDFFTDFLPVGKLFRDYKRHQDLLIVHYWNMPLEVTENRLYSKRLPAKVRNVEGTYTNTLYNVYAVDKHGNYYEIIPKLTWVQNRTNQVHDCLEEIEFGIKQYKTKLNQLFNQEFEIDELDDLDPYGDQVADLMMEVGKWFKPVIVGFDINLVDEEYDYYNPHRWDQSTHDYVIPHLLSYLIHFKHFKPVLLKFFDNDVDKANQMISTGLRPLNIEDIDENWYNKIVKSKGF